MDNKIIYKGVEYDLEEWLTFKRYAEKHHLKTTNRVSNWVARGIVPKENIIEITELNGLKLIKDTNYKS